MAETKTITKLETTIKDEHNSAPANNFFGRKILKSVFFFFSWGGGMGVVYSGQSSNFSAAKVSNSSVCAILQFFADVVFFPAEKMEH